MKKRVLIITSTFPRTEKDRQIPWMGKLLRQLKSKGLDIEVFAPAYRSFPSHTYFGIEIHRFRYAPAFLETLTHEEGAIFKLRRQPWLFFLPIFYLFFGTIAIFQRARDRHYDIIHVHWPFPQGLFGIVAKWITSARLILTFYGAEFALMNRVPGGRTVLRFIVKQADQIVAISNFTKRRILEIADVPVKVIPFASGISRTRNKKIRKKGDGTKKILFVGRLIERKGVIYLLKTMPQTLEKVNARLDIVGGGPLFSQLSKQVKKMKLSKNIFLHGKISEKKLVNLYQDCDVFVLPAIVDKWGDTEGLGVVLLEAMSFKKPVVASRVGGITDIVKHNKTGILVPQRNSQALVKAIVKILTDKNLANKLAQSGYQYLQDKFHWERIISETIKIYR